MRPFEDENELAAALRELRPATPPELAARLDARAAAGFPRDSRRAAAALERLQGRLAATSPLRLLVPVGAAAIFAVAVATAVIAGSGSGTDSRTALDRTYATTVPSTPRSPEAQPAQGAEKAAGARSFDSAAGESGAAAGSGIAREAAPSSGAGSAGRSGPYASPTRHRDVERSAEVVLGADPGDVRRDSAEVFDAVHTAGGIVLSSSIRDGAAGAAGADFELLIPTGRLGDALAAISAIAEVRSRNEASRDITAPTVTNGERLADARAEVESLLGQLADAEDGAERAAVRAKLRSARHRVAALRSRHSALERRGNFSRVSVRIETGESSSSGSGGAGWGVDDGLRGAGRVLAIAAGVTAIGLAILAPLALLGLLAWLGRRVWLRLSRRAALRRA